MRNIYTSSNHVHDTRNANCSEYPFRRQSTFPETNESDREQQFSLRLSNTSDTTSSSVVWDNSPPSLPATPSCDMSYSPLSRSPWSSLAAASEFFNNSSSLIRSLVREKGHVYSLAASGDLLYTGSDSKNIRIWKNHKEFSGFKSSSGLVKAIVIAAERIFTGHQDGKIRVWKVSKKDQSIHKKVGTLPTLKAKVKSSFNPSNYVEVRRNRSAIWIKHVDAISCLSLSEDKMLLYSASWDKRIKVWRLLDSKCLESINAHDDAVNAVVAGFDGLVFSGSADGTVKVWRREMQGKGTKHFFSRTLIKQESAVTSLAVDPSATILYAGTSDGLVNFWERHKFLSHGGVLRGHKLAVLCLATAGDLVFSGSADTSICVWRREGEGDHACLSVLNGHSGPVKCLAVEEEKAVRFGHQDRQYIVYSGSLDKSVKIWRVSGHAEVMQTPRGSWSQTQERSNWDDSLSRKLHAIQKQQQTQLCSPTQNQHPERFSGQTNAIRTPRTKTSSPMQHGLLTQNQHPERLSGQLNAVQMQQMTQNQTPGRSSGQMNAVRTHQSSPVIHYSPKQNQSLERFPGQFNAIQTQQSLPKQRYSPKQHQSLERFPGQFNAIQMQPDSPMQHGLTTQNQNPERFSGQLNTRETRPVPQIQNPNLEKFSGQLKAIQTRPSPSTRNQNLERFSGRLNAVQIQPSTPVQQQDHVENCNSPWNFPSSSRQDFSNQGIRCRMSRRTRY